MDLDTMLRQFKETVDETHLRGIQDTADLERRIRNNVRNRQKRRFRMLSQAGITAVAMVLVCFIALYQWQTKTVVFNTAALDMSIPGALNGGPAISPSDTTSSQLPSDQKIAEKVNWLQQQIRLKMTQEEVRELLGADYAVVDDSGDLENGTDELWNYSYLKQAGYVPAQPLYMVDEEGLSKKRVGVNLFLGWKQKKLYLFSISYGKGNDAMFYATRPDGITMQENLTTPTASDSMEKGPFNLDLRGEQKEWYMEFAKVKKDDALIGLDPIDIFKMYYHAQEIADYETQYAFYNQESEYEIPSLQQLLRDAKADRTGVENGRQFIKELRDHGKQYEIKWQNENEAVVWITYDNDRDPLGFQLRKTKAGIWKVCWMPIQ